MQMDILKKKLKKQSLNSNEKTYYYKYIKPKVRAMMSFFNINEINIIGKEYMINDRLKEATEILHKLEKKHKGKKIILSGSFLFNQKYNDIDAFVFSKYINEDYKKGKLHVSFLKESAIESLFFSSLSQISISNFVFSRKQDFNIELNRILHAYEMLINSILNKENCGKNLRDFILETEYVSKNVILNSKQLFHIKEKLLRKDPGFLSDIFINTLVLGFGKSMLSEKLQVLICDYKKLLKEYKSAKNLPIYIETYSKVISLVFGGSKKNYSGHFGK